MNGSTESTSPQPRLWPGVLIVALMWAAMKIPPHLEMSPMIMFTIMMFAPFVAAAAIAGWWLAGSRVPWRDRIVILVAVAAVGAAAWFLYHPSMQMGLTLYALPAALTAWVGWLVFTGWLSWPVRRAGVVAACIAAFGYYGLLRMDGVNGVFDPELAYRWAPTAEDKFLAAKKAKPAAAGTAAASALQPGDWPAFRGADRDSKLTGVRIAADWNANPPKEVWRQRVGPGWSSFAVIGKRIYTQEQRKDSEVVVCYDADTGAEVWVREDPDRFTEAVSGPGPRATPTFHDGKLYTLGAKGRLSCLDAATGAVAWTRDVAKENEAEVPIWGFSASPLVKEGVVTVFAGGKDDKGVAAYSVASGEPAWTAPAGKASYSSLQPAKFGGTDQILIVTDEGLTALDPAGKKLWSHDWSLGEMVRCVQPTLVGDADVLLGSPFSMGTKRLKVSRDGDKWATSEVWSSKAVSPYYNDGVVHAGHYYGFDGNFLVCVNLEDGKRKWKERGYGNGQVLLLADQGLLLVMAETGEVALVRADPAARSELCKFKALEGKTWNHPVIAHGRLFVRNAEEAACFDLKAEPAAAAAGQ